MRPWFPGRLPLGRWWAQRSAREQVLIALATAMLVVYTGVAGGLRPLLAARAEARDAIARYDADLARMAASPDSATAARPDASRPAATVLTDTAPDFGLDIRRIEAEGDLARVELADAAFADVLGWLDALHRTYALRPVAVEMDRRAAPGIVAARLSFAR